jgi:hypothetical protein
MTRIVALWPYIKHAELPDIYICDGCCQPDLTASLQAENKRLLEALKETNEEIRSGIESNVELEAEHSVFARELTAKNDALISEIEGRK